MAYRIEQEHAEREPFGEYRYCIYSKTDLVAKYWHDYRGDEHGIEFMDGRREAWPVGRMIEFVEGGGPLPLSLSPRAQAYLRDKLR
ncbi:hypothetical protein QLQ15_13260 [Lysobacter sp. LF1]|uniref:DUF3601 domain-containing protein n=1 Tax=Lysobacter stagni TaxID=3045172 RepID=A0ABT6XI97_9GAMM|nr:hypothetical protein [Lysobacter sp. LF1]MDI9239874.1 hypothetical protein [Lysobacter sp. LF1]